MFQCNLHLLIVLALYVPAVYCFHHCDEFTVTEAENWLTLHHVYDNRSAALPVLGEILAARDHPTIHTRLTDQNRCSAVSLTGPGRLDGQWYSIQTPEPHLVFEPQSCQLRRLSAASARHCLDGKYIVFIGDSLTRYAGCSCRALKDTSSPRYQYLSFAYFLSHMKHLPRYHGLQTPHLNDVRDWKRGWNQFMLEGSKQLMDVRTRACGSESRDQRSTQDAAPGASVHELCDCNREETNETARSGQGFREFRRLCIAANSPAERACFDTDRLGPGTLKVGYQQAMGHPTWYQAPLESLRALLSERPLPDVVVVNAGLWAPQGQYTTPEGPELALQHYRVLLGGASAMVRLVSTCL